MRLFIAVNFTDEVQYDLERIISELKKDAVSGSFTTKEHRHLTLVFLGEVPQNKVKSITQAMDLITGRRETEPFDLTLEGLGKFGEAPEFLYWVGIRKNKQLTGLQRDLSEELKALGFMLENRAFSPHITLGRRCMMKPDFNEKDFASNIPEIVMPVTKIQLMKSETINGILKHTEIYTSFLL